LYRREAPGNFLGIFFWCEPPGKFLRVCYSGAQRRKHFEKNIWNITPPPHIFEGFQGKNLRTHPPGGGGGLLF